MRTSKINNVINDVSLPDYVNNYVDLKPDGDEYKGCCPFHDEKTPSFTLFQRDKWRYHCFGCGESGDIIDFAMAYHGMNSRNAVLHLQGKSATPDDNPERKRAPIIAPDVYAHYKPIVPVPKLADNQRIKARAATPPITNPKRGGKSGSITPAWVYPYHNYEGELVCMVLRIDLGNGKKITPTVSWCEKPDGTHGWCYMRPDRGLLPPYGIRYIQARAPDTPICIVEGEKCADAVGVMLKRYIGMTWLGGTNAADKVNWSCLQGRRVLLLPDNDGPGQKAADTIQAAAIAAGAIEVKRLQPDPDKPDGWDIADAMADDMPIAEYTSYLKARILQVYPDPEESKPVNKDTAKPAIAEPAPAPAVVKNERVIADVLGNPPFIAWLDQRHNGNPLPTGRNFKQLVDAYGVDIRYNAMTKEPEIRIPKIDVGVENALATTRSYLIDMCAATEYSTQNFDEVLQIQMDKKTYNPAQIWVDSKEWDGEDRIGPLAESMNAKDEALAYILLKRWLISAVAALYEPNGVAAQGALVLVGKQYDGKTTWLKKLVGGHPEFFGEGKQLDPRDRDSKHGCLQHWLVELGELDATFRKADIATLKAFITSDTDEYRMPYARTPIRHPRRTVFAATVNGHSYLQDETGNRRYWTVECTDRLDIHHGLDMQQVWAQAATLYRAGESWALSLPEMDLLNANNASYEDTTPEEDLLLKYYDPMIPARPNAMSATDIVISIGYDRPTRLQTRSIAACLRRHFGEPYRSSGRSLFKMPEKRD